MKFNPDYIEEIKQKRKASVLETAKIHNEIEREKRHIPTLEKIVSDLSIDKNQVAILEQLNLLKHEGKIKDYKIVKINNDYHTGEPNLRRSELNLEVYLTENTSDYDGFNAVLYELFNFIFGKEFLKEYTIPQGGLGKGYYAQKDIKTNEYNKLNITYYSPKYNKF